MIHLHRHSEFSRLDGVGTAQQYAERAAEMGQPALALTDHGTLSGALHHISACRKVGIIPITGVEAYYRPDRTNHEQRKAWHLCLFAKNLVGWHSLLKITSEAYDSGFYQYPCVDRELLDRYHEGLACSTACISGWLAHCIKQGDDVGADEYLVWMKDRFGDDFWLEIMPHDFPEQAMINVEIYNLGQKHGIPLVATTDAHFPYKQWAETQQIAKLMSVKSSFAKIEKKRELDSDAEGFAKLIPSAYLMDQKEVRLLFKQAHGNLPLTAVDEAIQNTYLMAKSMTPFILDRKDKLPRVSESVDESEKILREWCEEGLDRVQYGSAKVRGSGHIKLMVMPDRDNPLKTDEEMQVYRERFDYEFGVLKEKGVLDYFVLVGDVVRWAKSQDILVGLGRGSAAGCLVSYLIGITAIDPIAWGLLFERFLNPGRKGLPDIDIDFQHDRRDEVKDYIADKYGHDHVADVISHQTFQPKAVIMDIARTFDIPYTEINALNKKIEIRQDDEETTLEEIRGVNETLDAFAKKYPEVWKHALRLEGSIRNSSKHASAVVITDKPIADYMALERSRQGTLITSWADRADFPAVSDHGFVKIDALGTRGLTKQALALQLIEERHDEKIDLNALGVLSDPHDTDPKVLEIFHRGLTLGLWQFGRRGITNLLKSIKPDWGGDICAANALYRPGPMGTGATWDYADLKKGDPDDIDYWDESIRFALAETFGIIAYQEQVMTICMELGGFTGGQADDMRKAMGKLYRLPGSQARKFMSGFKSQWDKGTKERGIKPAVAEDIWKKILAFGGYGFNKSHSACYALQAYQDAHLKAYYPHEFYCALLHYPPSTTQKNAEEKSQFIRALIREASVFDVEVAPPDINRSARYFALDNQDRLRFGLGSINDVGLVAAQEILDKRPFKSWEDFQERVPAKKANQKVRTALIESGAADAFHMRDQYSGTEIMKFERARLGVSLTMPSETQQHAELIEANIHSNDEFETIEDGKEVIAGGDVIEVKPTQTKKGEDMAFVQLAFGANQWRCVFFPGQWKAYQDLIERGRMMVVGKKDTWNATVSIKVNQAIDIETWAANIAQDEEERVAG